MKLKILALLTLGVFLAFTGCDNIVDERLNAAEEDRIDVEMNRLSMPSQPAAEETTLTANPSDPDYSVSDDNFLVTKKSYYNVPEMGAYMASDLPDNVLWPGAILDSAAFVNGSYKEIASDQIKRAPLTITTDANYSGGTISQYIENPNEVTVKQAVNDLIYQKGAEAVNTTKYLRSSFNQFTSSSEFSTKVKTTLGYKGALFDANLSVLVNKASSTKKSKMILEFTQCYFTIRPALVSKPSNFFDTTQTSWSDISAQLSGSGVRPVFVSSIDYGRSLMAVIESDEEMDSLEVNVNAYATFLKSKGNVSTDIQTKVNNLKSSSSITAVVVGGNGSYANLTTFDGIKTWLDEAGGIEFVKPLRYTLRYLTDPNAAQPAGFVTGGEYYEKLARWEIFVPTYTTSGNITVTNNSFSFSPLTGMYIITYNLSGGNKYRVSGYFEDNTMYGGAALTYFWDTNGTIPEASSFVLVGEGGSLGFRGLPYSKVNNLVFERKTM